MKQKTKRDKTHSLGEEKITRLLLRFSLPAILAMAVNASYNIVDTIFVGKLGAKATAALSICYPVQMILGAVAIGTGIGAGSLIARSFGAKDQKKASLVAGQVFLLSMIFGLAATLTSLFFLRPLLVLFGATPEILEATVEYMSVIASGAFFLFFIMMMNHVTRAEGNPTLSMVVMISSAVINIILDPIFIFGLGMGIKGAAVATIIAKIAGAIIQSSYFLTGRSALTISWKHLRPNFRIIWDIYKVGLPSLLIQVSGNLAIIIANRILGGFSHIPIAVMGIVLRMQMLAFMPVIGISQGLIPIVGYNFGAQKPRRIREALYKGAAAGSLFSTLVGITFFLFPGFFLQIFTDDAGVLAVGTEALPIMVLIYPLLGPQSVSITFFQATGKALPSLLLSILRQFILYVPLLFFLPRFLGLPGIWAATPIADLLAFTITLSLVLREFRIQGIPLISPKDA
ncbi:MAG TPA: MATE family efflux transporter [Firmicutes bacterium]|jgi:putative MATE family efflux protein|nr:MATE family efflux transporter [Bacillota bacterium]